MSNVPAQVEEAGDLAEQLHAQMFNTDEGADQYQDTDDGPDENADSSQEYEDDNSDGEDDSYKSRYQSLKGKYDKEVPRLSQELRELKDNMFTQLQAALLAQQAANTPQQVETAQDSTDEIMDQFAETYGEDFTENIRKLIALEAKKLTGSVEEKVNSLEETQYKAAQNDFVNYIDDQLKDTKLDWKSAWDGKDPRFLEFLKQPDPSGYYTYGQLAELANKQWDGDRIAQIFKTYTETIKQPVQRTQQSNPARNAIVAPSRNNTHTAPDTSSKQVWTQDMIQEFQMNDRKGKYSPDESKAMWDDLLAALGENRIR